MKHHYIFSRLWEAIINNRKIYTRIIFYQLIAIGVLLFAFYFVKSASIDVNGIFNELLKILFIVIFLGIILGITSNYLYDRIKEYWNDPIMQAARIGKFSNIFLSDIQSDQMRRTNLTIERILKMDGEVCLQGIAASTYLPIKETENTSLISTNFIKQLREKRISLRIILLNPFSESAKFRYARENNLDLDDIVEVGGQKDNYVSNSLLYADIQNTIKKINLLKAEGAQIECRFTNFEPTISLMYSNDFGFLDILSLGRIGNIRGPYKQSSTFPVLEFTHDSKYYNILKSHFDYHWKYSITIDEFEKYKSIFKRKFYQSSFTGYKLINQHESWVSIDPITGCSNACSYCVLQTSFGNNVKPKLYADIETIGDKLRDSRFFINGNSIISLFNYTDAFLPLNLNYLIRSLEILKVKNIENTVCISTKSYIDRRSLEKVVKAYYRDKIILFISYSGLSPKYEKAVNPNKIIELMKNIKDSGIHLVHYWRPVTNSNSSLIDIDQVLNDVTPYSSCSVVTGLKASDALNKYYLKKDFITSGEEKNSGDYLPDSFVQLLGKKVINYPVYFHSSCAVSKILGKPDYNGTMFRDDICPLNANGKSKCSDNQMYFCKSFKHDKLKNFNENTYKSIIQNYLPDMEVSIINKEIELMDPVYQEDFIHLTHKLNYPLKPKH